MSLQKRMMQLTRGLPHPTHRMNVVALVNAIKDLYGDGRINEATMEYELHQLIMEVLVTKQPEAESGRLLEQAEKIVSELKRLIRLETLHHKRLRILMGRS